MYCFVPKDRSAIDQRTHTSSALRLSALMYSHAYVVLHEGSFNDRSTINGTVPNTESNTESISDIFMCIVQSHHSVSRTCTQLKS